MKSIAPAAMAAIEAGEAIVTGAVEIARTTTLNYSEVAFIGAKTYADNDSTDEAISLTDLKDEDGNNIVLTEGDVVVITYVIGTFGDNYTQAELTPTGYTDAHADLFANDSSDTNLQVSYKFMGAVPDTTFTLPGAHSTSEAQCVHVLAIRGVDPADPIDYVTTATGIDEGKPNPPAITLGNHRLVTVHGGASGNFITDFTNPGDLSASTRHFLSVSKSDTISMGAVGVGMRTASVGSGTFDPAQWGGGSASTGGSWASVCIAWRPVDPEIVGAAGAIRVWGGYGPITIDGEEYTGMGSYGLAQSTSGAIGGVAQGMTLGLSGIDATALSLLDDSDEIQGAFVVIRRLIFASDGKTLLGSEIWDRGKVDTVETDEVVGGPAGINLAVESAARGLGRSGARMRSDADQRLINEADGYFRNTAYAAEKSLYWGGKKPNRAGGALSSAGSGGFIGSTSLSGV